MKKKKGFTLVELLAVIVILAIILVIAVPQIMNTIDEAREGALSSSAKLIAASAEREFLVQSTLDSELTEEEFNENIDCNDLAESQDEYENCTVTISNGKATVQLEGAGKFAGKYVCAGTRTSAKVTEDACGLVCAAGTTKVVKSVSVVKPYEVENAESCKDYFTNYFINNGISQEDATGGAATLCGGGMLEGMTFPQAIEILIAQNLLTEQELIVNNVIKRTIGEVCVPNTDESCFAFDNGSITGYDISCGTDVIIPETINSVAVTEIGANAFTTQGDEVVSISNHKNIYPSKLNITNTYVNLVPLAWSPGEGIGITSVVIPNTVTRIEDGAFHGNLIISLTIPSSVEYIGQHTFDGNPLETINLENTSAELHYCAFGNTGLITTHNIPESYTCE